MEKRAIAGVAAALAVALAAAVASRSKPRAPEPPASIGPVPVASVAPPSAADVAPSMVVPFSPWSPSDAGPSPACRLIAAANHGRLASVDGGACKAQEPELGCMTTGTGVTWGYEIRAASAKYEGQAAPDSGDGHDFDCSTEVEVELVRTDARGARTVGGKETLHRAWYHEYSLSLTALADYDGDGEVEVLRVRDGHEHEGGPVRETSMLTFANGAIGPYAKLGAVDIEEVEDVDGDGRPDLVTRGPYGAITMDDAFGNSWPAGPVLFLAHALPDGTFRVGDPVSIAYTRAKCPSRPALSFREEDLQFAHGAEEAVVCARLWGAAEAEVRRAWTAACVRPADADTGGMPCGTWAKELAAVAPPFILR